MPEGTSTLKPEDPRLPMMMAPVARKDAPEALRRFVYVQPEVGDVLLWESWVRHEVPRMCRKRSGSRSAPTTAGLNTSASCSMGM